jgi:hypothetical protein
VDVAEAVQRVRLAAAVALRDLQVGRTLAVAQRLPEVPELGVVPATSRPQ